MKKYAFLFTFMMFTSVFSMHQERQKSWSNKIEDIIFSLAHALQNNEQAMKTLFVATHAHVSKR